MGLINAYLTSTKNVSEILEAIQGAQAPERFTMKFLEDLGFRSKSDRLIINVLKGLKFLDETGSPTQRYFEFLDSSESKKVLAEGVREAYEDLFRINKNAQKMSQQEVANKLKTLTEGKKSESVITKMASTFSSLCSLADFSDREKKIGYVDSDKHKEGRIEPPQDKHRRQEHTDREGKAQALPGSLNLNYDIHIHLPVSRDPAVFDALFRSLKEHLL